jgi:transcriptional regulator with XRE-family HTH domain
MSLVDLALISGVSKAYIFRLETAPKANPSLDVMGRIADALDTTIAELLGRPSVRIEAEELDISPTLKAFADDAGLSQAEIGMLASIRWRKGDAPQTTERWRYIWNSLRSSRALDDKSES